MKMSRLIIALGLMLLPLSATMSQLIFPITTGRLVFHRYANFSDYSSQLYMYDFDSGLISLINASWPIDNATNAHFSPDGKQLVFMGVESGLAHTRANWDIFLWDVGSSSLPVNLTKGNGVLDQDPKFFFDGKRIAFKHDGDIAVINIATKIVTKLTNDGATPEQSMPYPTVDGQYVVYCSDLTSRSKIMRVNVSTLQAEVLQTADSVQQYYPIVRDDSTYLYVRWATPTSRGDQTYLGNFRTGESTPVAYGSPGFDYSDPFPADSENVFFSSTRSDTKGGYDLYLGNMKTGKVWSLSRFFLNTSLHELGSCYTKFGSVTSLPPSNPTPQEFHLNHVYPNPFNPDTNFGFRIVVGGLVRLDVFDVVGREVSTLVNRFMAPGDYSVHFSGSGLASGVYFARLESGTHVAIEKMVLAK